MWKILLISFMMFQIGCAKKNSADKTRQSRLNKTQESSGQTSETKPTVETSSQDPDKNVPNLAEPVQAPDRRDEEPLVMQKSAPEVKQNPIQTSQKESVEKKATVVDAEDVKKSENKVALATDSEIIKTQAGYRIAFRNLEAVEKLSQNNKLVIMRQKEVELTSPQALLGQLNEEHYCQIKLEGKFHSQDFLLMDLQNSNLEQIDKDLDLFRTQLQFKNSNGVAILICDHTTSNFYLEEMYMNLGHLIVVYGLDNQPLDIKNYINPRTERRKINAIKIKDIEKLNQIIMKEDAKESQGMASGEVDSSGKLIDLVTSGQKDAACEVTEKLGDFKTDRVYIRVDKGILEDTPKEIPTATLFSTYRADKDHFFVLACIMKKTAEWNVLFDVMKGVFEFGVLERPVYNKTFDEIKALHTKK